MKNIGVIHNQDMHHLSDMYQQIYILGFLEFTDHEVQSHAHKSISTLLLAIKYQIF